MMNSSLRINTPARGQTAGDGATIAFHYWLGRGVPIVCIHGLTASSMSFVGLAESFAGRHAVLSIDLRGRGNSDKPVRAVRPGAARARCGGGVAGVRRGVIDRRRAFDGRRTDFGGSPFDAGEIRGRAVLGGGGAARNTTDAFKQLPVCVGVGAEDFALRGAKALQEALQKPRSKPSRTANMRTSNI